MPVSSTAAASNVSTGSTVNIVGAANTSHVRKP
jgi:hypothetical protein